MNRLGVDIGGVIIDRVNDGTDTSFFGDNYLDTTAVEGSFEALRELGKQEFKDGIWVVSKCGPHVQAKSEAWLAHRTFYAQTDIEPDRVRFTPTRRGKAEIAASLGLSHFVDDRLEVLSYMIGSVPNLYLFSPELAEVRSHKEALPQVTVVRNWQEALRALRP